MIPRTVASPFLSVMKLPFLSSSLRAAAVAAVLLCQLAAASSAQAQATKIFVASNGNDANDGSRGFPKRSFQPAHDAVAAGGSIVVLDTAGYGALNITKALVVTVPPGVNGFVSVTGSSDGITINAGSTAAVALRGLIIEGVGTGGTSGIRINSAASVRVEDCTVRSFGSGINLLSSGVQLTLANDNVRNCVSGLLAQLPAATVVASACRFEVNSSFGVVAGTTSGGTGIDVTLSECVIAGNTVGVGGASAGTVVRLSDCVVFANSTGILQGSGAQILSRVNNTLEVNPNGNIFPGTYSAR